ncbi:MAG: Tn3 family transposase [Rhodospirillales bacterium]|nr:Tn3 family transposase [Rhodospirillales bacterium]
MTALPLDHIRDDAHSDSWILTDAERSLVTAKHHGNRLAFAVLLLFFRVHGRFLRGGTEIDEAHFMDVAAQIGATVPTAPIPVTGRTVERNRAEIRSFFGFREATVADADRLEQWLTGQVAAVGSDPEPPLGLVEQWCRDSRIEPPSPDRVDRVIRAALRAYDEQFCASTVAQLAPETRVRLDALLRPAADISGEGIPSTAPALLLRLRDSPGRPSLASIQDELAKLDLVREIGLPDDLFRSARPHDVERYRRRVAVEAPYELRRHPEAARLTWLAAYIHLRGRSLTDDGIDLLIETIHHIGARAERRVEREMLNDLKRITGKQNILFELADASLEQPDGIVREVVFPVVGKQTLRDLVKEWRATGPAYRSTLRTVIRNSYKGHYRRMVPEILRKLEFRSNNEHHRPVIDALDLLKRYADSTVHLFPPGEVVPIDGVAAGLWREAAVERAPDGRERVNRITYEICVLEALRRKLRCKEIWVVGANRYRNPDEDLPTDFDAQRRAYYQVLDLPLDPDRFIADVQAEMREALSTLDSGLPHNPLVCITSKRGGTITVTPFEPQPDPPNLAALKAEITSTWPMTSLLDMVKETDLRLGFTDALKSPTAYETMDRAVLRPRLLLCLHGLGTNAGLQRMASLESGVTDKDLAYVRRRYLTVDALRRAVALVTDGTLHARSPALWGDGTTSCASDSKHFGAWDQNLTTQWHVRYGGRGVMIYWHVERKSLCIHSQLKSPSSSEVASMIEGVVHHCTEMEVDRQYVDSHGQSTVAFAFCRLLGFHLMPRLKAINAQKLSRPEAGQPDAYPNLQSALTKPVDWETVRQQYDQMVKYVTAVRLGTAETEAILRRFTRNNVQHPTYRGFAELGRAVKTIFLCRYLHSEALRREINEGLNVIEQWNGANDFVFFARRGEMTSNRREDHEISMLALHLLQNCLVYINTLMLQQVLAKPHWQGRLGPRDLSALTPLIWDHVNPYGRFELDMNARLSLD